jgi:hypothetical protein
MFSYQDLCLKTVINFADKPKSTYLDAEKVKIAHFSDGVINFECKSGYQLIGSVSLFCDNGKLNGTEPSCVQN